MATDKNEPWFVAKRAQAYVYSLLAERDLSVRDSTEQNLGVDLLLDLRKGNREAGRYLAVQIIGCREFPDSAGLNELIARQLPPEIREELVLPLVAFVVQFQKLAALYTWLNEPVVEKGAATIRQPIEYVWAKLDDKAVDRLLTQVDQFYDALMKPVGKTSSRQ